MTASHPAFHVAQLNVARNRAPLDSPEMAGFVWRLVDAEGANATALRPYGPDLMVNMSVWKSIEALYEFTYRTAHLDVLRHRRDWFDHDGLSEYTVLWWVPAGTIPTLEEARRRLDLLSRRAPSPEAFTFRERFPPPG